MKAVLVLVMTVVTTVATMVVALTGLLVTGVALFALVSSHTVVIHPYGPRMCEQLANVNGFKLNIAHIFHNNLSTDHIPKNNQATFYTHNLTCLLLGPEMDVDGQADKPFSLDTYTCFNKSDPSRDNVQMRRVMCTEFPATLMCEVICQHVHVHTVCAFISGNRSCVFTTNQDVKDKSRNDHGYCTKSSDSTRKSRQMKCVMVSKLTAKRKRDTMQVDNHTISKFARQRTMPDEEYVIVAVPGRRVFCVNIVTGLEPVNVTVKGLRGIVVPSYSKRDLDIPHELKVTNGVEYKGISVVLNITVATIMVTYHGYRSKPFIPFPVSALGRRYILTSGFKTYSYIVVIATHSKKAQVKIEFRMKGKLSYGNSTYMDGDILNLELMEYQTFTLRPDVDVTGTVVTSTQTVAVFFGYLKQGNIESYNQLLPVEHFGQEYVVTNRPGYELNILSENNDTSITFNEGSTVTVDKNGLYRRKLAKKERLHFTSSRPVLTTMKYRHIVYVVPPVDIYTTYMPVRSQRSFKVITTREAGPAVTRQSSWVDKSMKVDIYASDFKVFHYTPHNLDSNYEIISQVPFTVILYRNGIFSGGFSFKSLSTTSLTMTSSTPSPMSQNGGLGYIRRDRDMCQFSKLKKEYYLNGTNSINCVMHAFERVPLQFAEKTDITEMFDFFLSLGSHLKLTGSSSKYGRDLLHEACFYCRLDMVQRLVDLGFDVERRAEDGKTPILTAALKGCTDVVIYLYGSGCDITVVDKDKRNILHIAASDTCRTRSVLGVLRFILAFNVSRAMLESTDEDFQTPVHHAVKAGRPDILKLLVQNGCNMIARTGNGKTVLHLAAMGARLDIVRYIISLNVLHANCTDNSSKTPLQLALEKLKIERRSAVKTRYKHVIQYLRNITKT